MATLRDVAQKAGVTYSSVSKIINGGKEGVFAPETVKRVREAARALGYAINYSARSLKTGRTGMIGISSATRRSTIGFKDPYLNDIYTGINNFFIKTDYKLLFEHYSQVENLDALCRDAARGMVDGIIFILFAGEVRPFMERQAPYLAERNLPFVVVHSLPEPYPFPNVGYKADKGGYLGTRHLLDHGYRSIGFIDHSRPNPLSESLYAGHCRALADKGTRPDPGLRIPAPSFMVTDGQEVASRLLANGRDLPESFFCVEQGVAAGMMETFRQHGIAVPGDCAFVCFGHDVNDQVSISKLTTVENCGYDKGQRAALLLTARMEQPGGNPPDGVLIGPRLSVRTSCGCSPVPAVGTIMENGMKIKY